MSGEITSLQPALDARAATADRQCEEILRLYRQSTPVKKRRFLEELDAMVAEAENERRKKPGEVIHL